MGTLRLLKDRIEIDVLFKDGFKFSNTLTHMPIIIEGEKKYWPDCNNKEKILADAQILEMLMLSYALDQARVGFY